MKKNLLLLLLVIAGFTAKAQITFTASVSPVYANDASVTITAQGENTSTAVDMADMPYVTGTAIMITPNNQGYSVFFSLSNFTRVSYFNHATGAKSAFTAKVNTGGFGSNATVKFNLAVTFVHINSYTYSYGTVPFTVNTAPGSRPSTTYYSGYVSGTFTRNNCSVGNVGSSVSYSIPYGTYTSSVSQADANQQAQNAAQAYANANGTCSVDVSNWFDSWDNGIRIGSDWSTTVWWTEEMVSASGLTLEVYQNGVFKAVLATNLPNTGSAVIDFTPYCTISGHYFNNIKFKIISEDDPNVWDFSPEQNMQID